MKKIIARINKKTGQMSFETKGMESKEECNKLTEYVKNYIGGNPISDEKTDEYWDRNQKVFTNVGID